MWQGYCTLVITVMGKYVASHSIIWEHQSAFPLTVLCKEHETESKKGNMESSWLFGMNMTCCLFMRGMGKERRDEWMKEWKQTLSHLISISLHSLCTHFHEFKTESAWPLNAFSCYQKDLAVHASGATMTIYFSLEQAGVSPLNRFLHICGW